MAKVNPYDGTDTDLSYGQALCLAIGRIPLGNQELERQVLRAIQREHDLLPPDPEPEPGTDAYELAQLRKQVAELQAQKAEPAAPVEQSTPVDTVTATA